MAHKELCEATARKMEDNNKNRPLSNEELLTGPAKYAIATMMLCIKSNDDKRLEPILHRLIDLGVIKSWYYNGSYHAC